MPAPKPPIRAYRRVDRPEEFFNGIPNRDLTEDDWQALPDEHRQLVTDSGLWTVEPDQKVAPKQEKFEAQVEKQVEKAVARTEKAATRQDATTGGDASAR
jgi:hypothetical protein